MRWNALCHRGPVYFVLFFPFLGIKRYYLYTTKKKIIPDVILNFRNTAKLWKTARQNSFQKLQLQFAVIIFNFVFRVCYVIYTIRQFLCFVNLLILKANFGNIAWHSSFNHKYLYMPLWAINIKVTTWSAFYRIIIHLFL